MNPGRYWTRIARGAAGMAGLAAVAYWAPSVCVLGQWAPVAPDALPYGWCRWSGPGANDVVAITFDDGPSPEATPATLALLDELGMRATFFVLGTQAAAHPELIAAIRSHGHAIGCHGFQHAHHMLRAPTWIARDLDKAVEAIAATGAAPRWFRPPFGQLTTPTIVAARRRGLEVVLWSTWGREWVPQQPAAIVRRITRTLRPGAIVLAHDNDVCCGRGTAARMRQALPLLARELDDRGLRTVTLDELVAGPAATTA
jgi:peptidoglycan-N-acetylglucosamine deacetylase